MGSYEVRLQQRFHRVDAEAGFCGEEEYVCVFWHFQGFADLAQVFLMLTAGDFIGFGGDNLHGFVVVAEPLVHGDVVFGRHMAQIDDLKHKAAGIAAKQVVFNELAPFFPLFLAGSGKAVAGEIDEIKRRLICLNEVIVELARLAGLRAGARQILAANDAVDKR